MTTVNGSWVPNSSSNARMRLILDYTASNTSATVTRVQGTVKIGVGYGVSDSSNTFAVSGSLLPDSSGAKSIDVSTGGTQTLYTFDVNVTRGSSSATKSMSFSLTGVNYVGSSLKATVSDNVTIPAVATPPTPTSVTTTRVSTTQIRGNWSGGSVNEVQYRRRASVGVTSGSWGSWTTQSSSSQTTGYTFTVTTGYEYQVRVRRSDSGAWSAYGTSSNTAVLFDAPPPPTGATVTRNSDASWYTAITAPSIPGSQPIATVDFQRELDGTFANLATGLAPATRNYTDTTNLADRKVRYRARFWNSAGGSAWVSTGYTYGTPKPATGITAGRSGSADFVVGFTNKSEAATTFTVMGQTSDDGGATWSALADLAGHTGIAIPAKESAGSRTISGLDASKLWRFAIKVVTPNALTATSAVSSTVQALQPPAAATQLAPMSTQLVGSTVRFRWRHNALDGSNQTSAQLVFRVNGGGWTTRTISGTTDYKDEVLATAGTVDWYVRTKGAHADYGPDSATSSFLVANAPSVAVTSPGSGDTFTSNKVTAQVTFTDATGAVMTSWAARLYEGGSLLETKSGSGSTTSVAFSKSLQNLYTHSIEFEAVSGTGLKSNTATTTFNTLWSPPAPPGVSPVWRDEYGTTVVNISNAPGVVYSWTGATDRSASTEVTSGAETRRNLATNPKLTDTYGTVTVPDVASNLYDAPRGTAVYPPVQGLNASGMVATRTWVTDADGPVLSDGSRVTSYSRWTTTTPATSGSPGYAAIVTPRPGGGGVAGDKFTIVAAVRYQGAGDYRPRMRIAYYNAGGGATEGINSPTIIIPSSSEWTWIVWEGAATMTFASAGWWLYTTGTGAGQQPPAGSTVDITAVRFFAGPNDGRGFIDGDMTDPDGEKTYVWTGTAGQSPSALRYAGAETGSASQLRALGNLNLPVTYDGSVIGWSAPGGGIAVKGNTANNAGQVFLCGSAGMDAGGCMHRMGAAFGKWVAAGVLYSQRRIFTGLEYAAKRGIAVWRRTGATNALYQYGASAPNEVQTDTLLTFAWFADPTATDYALSLVTGHADNQAVTYWRNLIICQGDTEEEALAKVQSYFDGDTPGAEESVSNTVYRSDDGGETWSLLAEGIGLDTAYVDRSVPLNTDVIYRVASVSPLGVEAYEEVPVTTTSRRVWIGAGVDMFDIILDLNISFNDSQEVVLEDYLGRVKPTSHYGEGRPTEVSISGMITPRHGGDTAWRNLFGQDVFLRTPDGRTMWATLSGGISRSATHRRARSISFTATEVSP